MNTENHFVTQYQGIKRHSFRGTIRHITLTACATGYKIGSRIPKLLNRNRVQFIYLHHLFNDEENDFRRLLDVLQEHHTFISYSNAVRRVLEGGIDRPYICFSFDDGLKNNLRAAEILAHYDAHACFFVYPSMIGERDFEKIRDFNKRAISFPPVEYLSWDDVHHLQNSGHEIGGHSLSHVNMARASKDELTEETVTSKDILSSYCGPIEHFAWPYGRFHHFSPEARRAVYDAGYRIIASAERGCHPPSPQPPKNEELCIRRDHLIAGWPSAHMQYFLARNATYCSSQMNSWPW